MALSTADSRLDQSCQRRSVQHNLQRTARFQIEIAIYGGDGEVFGIHVENAGAATPQLFERLRALRKHPLRHRLAINLDRLLRMGGWGREFITVAPGGSVLPCHAAASIPGLTFANVRDASLADIWAHSEAFERFRGTSWMKEPCRSCSRRDEDFGGCRCQAMLLTGDPAATDPVCVLSPDRARLDAALAEATTQDVPFRWRRYAKGAVPA